ncbi:MAG: hypothetical protein N4A46_07425 [Schleiferiaceae bacterium]|jgi:hypothetical protein|nr:hypothetical protein [Schleiferiaceae bacterium]
MGLNLLRKLKEEKANRLQTPKFNAKIEEALNQDENLLNILKSRNLESTNSSAHFPEENLFELNDIKNICIHYRLRFLDAKLFKGHVPFRALLKMRRIEREHDFKFKSFKIIAPAELFQLEEKDKDPMLFGQMDNNKFYFIHKWGKDMHPLRKVLVFPFRSIETFIKSIFVVAAAIALSIPSSVMVSSPTENAFHIRMVFFFYVLFAVTAWSILFAYPRLKNFNASLWNSKYFD